MSTGIIYGFKPVHSQPKLILRKTDQAADEKLEKDIQRVISQIHSLSGGNENSRSATSAAEGFNLNVYYSTLSNLYAVLQPLLRDRFIDDLPRTVVCLLSGRRDCGLEAELTKTVSLDLVQPLLAFVSSLRSQSCAPQTAGREPGSFLKAYVRTGESTTAVPDGFQHSLTNILSSFPPSGKLMDAVSSLVDSAVKYALEFAAMLLQVPMEYIRIALQFGIRIPSLDEEETCEQGMPLFLIILSKVTFLKYNLEPNLKAGHLFPSSFAGDLKQLIMW